MTEQYDNNAWALALDGSARYACGMAKGNAEMTKRTIFDNNIDIEGDNLTPKPVDNKRERQITWDQLENEHYATFYNNIYINILLFISE